LDYDVLDYLFAREGMDDAKIEELCEYILKCKGLNILKWYSRKRLPWHPKTLDFLVLKCGPEFIEYVRKMGFKTTKAEILECANKYKKFCGDIIAWYESLDE
jgi:hypothetical protein